MSKHSAPKPGLGCPLQMLERFVASPVAGLPGFSVPFAFSKGLPSTLFKSKPLADCHEESVV